MARACTICAHPDRDAIEADRQRGATFQVLAARYGLATSTLKRHMAAHADRSSARTGSPGDPNAAGPHASADRARVSGQNIPPAVLGATQRRFLDAFVAQVSESAACRIAHIDRKTVRNWEKTDPTFALRYQDAERQVNDAIDAEIARRGIQGVPEPLVSTGKVIRNDDGTIMTVQKYSDRMLELLAKARMPRKYGDKQQIEHSGAIMAIPGDVVAVAVAQVQAQRGVLADDDDLGAAG